MKYTKTRLKALILTPLVALVALALTIPFNMGGCSEVGSQLGAAIGGQQGQAIGGALGKYGDAEMLGEKDEIALGQSVAVAITNARPLLNNAELSKYVTLVGMTLADASDRPDAKWVFGVIDSPDANAFSGPGGYVMVTRGLIAQLHDESELAGVLAHEITHVTEKHGLKAVKKVKKTEAIVEGASAASKEVAQFMGTADAAVTAIKNGFSQEQETEADAGAVKVLVYAGYDPHGFLNFIERVAKTQGSGGNALMSTHPGAADRAVKIRQRIEKLTLTENGAVLRDRFEKMTRG